MEKVKKMFVGLLCLMLLFATVSCNQSGHDPESETMSQGTEEQSNNNETTSDSETTNDSETSNETETVEQNNYFEVNVIGIQSSYVSGSYIHIPDDLFMITINHQRYFYIPRWGKCFLAPDDYSYVNYIGCGAVGEKTAWIFKYEDEQTGNTNGKSTIFTMLKINRETGIQERSTVLLPRYIYGNFYGMFSNMLDDNTGFVFIYETDNENLEQMRLAAVMKTTDGGMNWTTNERDTSWFSSSWRNCPTVSHFFDENNGLIVLRVWGHSMSQVYVTSDGGKTWNWARIPYNDYDPEFIYADDRYLELEYFEYWDGEYSLTFRLKGWGVKADSLVTFVSTDFKTWAYIP